MAAVLTPSVPVPPPLSSATRGAMAPARAMATWVLSLTARFRSARAAASLTLSVPPPLSSATILSVALIGALASSARWSS